jgi:hypothetical protein
MPEITLPEVKLPDIHLPDGFRDMSRDDIVQAARDIRMPKVDLKKIEMPDIDLSDIDLPKSIADRLPRRRRTNPLIPFIGLAAIGAAIVGVWWLFTSRVTGARARHLAYTVKARLTGEPNDVIPYDDEANLGSLVTDTNGSMGASAYDRAGGVPVGPGETTESKEPVPASTF